MKHWKRSRLCSRCYGYSRLFYRSGCCSKCIDPSDQKNIEVIKSFVKRQKVRGATLAFGANERHIISTYKDKVDELVLTTPTAIEFFYDYYTWPQQHSFAASELVERPASGLDEVEPPAFNDNPPLYVGVDPSIGDTLGVCIADHSKKVRQLLVLHFFEYQDVLVRLREENPDRKIVVAIEDTSKQTFVYSRTHINTPSMLRALAVSFGKNSAAAQLCLQWARLYADEVRSVTPKAKGKKLTPEFFKKLANYEGNLLQSQQHAIDGYGVLLTIPNF